MDVPSAPGPAHRAGVWGSPIAHSLSPVLHRAAYRALGLNDWDYAPRLVEAAEFAGALAGLDGSWRGLSLTMPLKEAALAAATRASDTARLTGAANTLIRRPDGWWADNTDVLGLVDALTGDVLFEPRGWTPRHDPAGSVVPNAPGPDGGDGPGEAVVLGSGATARSALVALRDLGVGAVTVAARRLPEATRALLAELGLTVRWVPLGQWPASVSLVVSTVPPDVAGQAAAGMPAPDEGRFSRVIDVVYGGGITPLMRHAATLGYAIVPGTEMLLHQAAAQMTLMTGRPAPLAAMRAALWRAVVGD